MLGVVHIIDVSEDEQKEFVLELVGCASVDGGVEEAELADVEIGYLEAVAYPPFFIILCQDYYCMQFGCESDKLAPDASIQEHGGHLIA